MTAANPVSHIPLKTHFQYVDFTEDAEAEVLEGTAEALALEEGAQVPAELGDFTYSATAESNGGAPTAAQLSADPLGLYDLDAQPGLIYSGPSGVAVEVRFTNLDIVETNDEAPEATDEWTAAVFVNNTLMAYADEGYVSELDTQTAAELNLADGTYVTLNESDVLRVALISQEGNEDDQTVDVAEGGQLVIIG